jgi:hypothetical protein
MTTLAGATLTNWVQALSALAVAVLTFKLVQATRRYTRETQRMADVMVHEFEFRVSPLLAFEIGETRQGSGWEWSQVPLVIRNVGRQAATVTEGVAEYWVDGDPTVRTQPLLETNFTLVPADTRQMNLRMGLTQIPHAHRVGATASGRLHYRVRYNVVGLTGQSIEGTSQDFND